MSRERPARDLAATYTPKSMEMGTLGLGRRPDLDALAEAKESVDRALDDLALAVLAAQERERARLADELHDGVAQMLSNLIMQAEIVERQLADHRVRNLGVALCYQDDPDDILEIVRSAVLAAAAFAVSAADAQRSPHTEIFAASDQCMACHNGLRTPSGEDVSIGASWRASMMVSSSGSEPT